ncbi:MAG TPA: ATP-dependent DNA ligase [Polyangiaceae bacterium]|nr:ATP-dependent DNA ligase [Polyangiaceae bacterium]
MLNLAEIVATSRDVGATRSRKQKTARLAQLLVLLEPGEVRAAVGFLCGALRQGKLGVGYRALQQLRGLRGTGDASVSVLELDAIFQTLSELSGKGSAKERERLLHDLFARLSEPERDFVARLMVGELRQGALEALVVEALGQATHISAAALQRAMLFAGDATEVAMRALAGGEKALAELSIELFRPLRPMLAQSAKDVAEAVTRLQPCVFERKLDGARIQLHRAGERVAVYSRHGNELTEALPEIVRLARSFDAQSLVLDGEAIALKPDGRPQPFQVTMRRFGRKLDVAELEQSLPLSAFFFDCLYRNGEVLVERTNEARWAALSLAVPEAARVVRSTVTSTEQGEAVMRAALASGHEGIVAKSLASTYEAGRRGAGWLKLKPAPTLDLVVLAAEWGSGRRKGLLSNLHLGAREPETGEFVMLGKTFKGLTDEVLRWQTQKLQQLATEQSDWVVRVRPELVVEIAFDGLQRSPVYPGGMALRFARVRRYRDDKPASGADTIGFVRSLYERGLGDGSDGDNADDDVDAGDDIDVTDQ